MEAFIKRLLPNQITTTSKGFRKKLLDDCDNGGLELADFLADTPVATVSTYELRKLSRTNIGSVSTTQHDHAAGITTATGTPGAPSASRHSRPVTSSFKESGSTATLPARQHAENNGLYDSHSVAPPVALQRWHGSAGVRLVVSVLLQHASDWVCQQQLQRFLQSTSWSEACQHCKDALLICVLLHHYFPHAVDLQQLAAASNCNSSSSSILADNAAPAGAFAVKPAGPGSGTYNSVEKQQHPCPRPEGESSNSSSEQQPMPSNLSELCLAAAAAAGVQVPARCSASSIAAGDPEQHLQLMTAIIVTGHMQQLMQAECRIPLQAAAAEQQLQQQQHLSQHQQQPQLQQGDEAVQRLLCAWLAVIFYAGTKVGCRVAVQEPADSTAAVQQRDLNERQQQLHHVDFSWQNVVDVLLHLQQAQQQQHHHQRTQSSDSDVLTTKHGSSMQQNIAVWHDPLTPVDNGKQSSSATKLDRNTSSHHSGTTCSSSSSSGDGGGNGTVSRSSKGRQGLLQQLSHLGCDMPLLQNDDLQDSFLHCYATGAPVKPQPLQLVLLMQLVYSTRHLWIPVIEQRLRANDEQLELAAYVMPLLQLQPQQQHSDIVSSCSGQCISRSDSELPSEDAVLADAVLNDASHHLETDTQLGRAVSDGGTSPRNSWPPELLTTSQLWPGDEEEMDDAFTREERTLRCWINSLLHRSRAGGSGGGACSRRGSSTGSGVGGSNPSSGIGYQQRSGSSRIASAVLEQESCSWDELKSVLSITTTADSVSNATAAELQDAAEAAVSAPATPTIGKRTSRSSSDADPQQQQQQQTNGGVQCSTTAAASPCLFSFSSISSLFGAEIRSGVLLLEVLEHLQPGCVDWKLANKLPFKMGAAAQLLALENCQLALKTAQEELGLPLVSMSPRDVVLGRRKIILSLVYQLMRYHTMQLLESIATRQQQLSQPFGTMLAAGLGCDNATAVGDSSPSVTPRAAAAATGRVKIFSSSRKQKRQLAITEQDILDWANSKLQQVQPLSAANGNSAQAATAAEDTPGLPEHARQRQQQLHVVGGPAAVARPVLTSFKDPLLASGLVLLQLLHVMDPEAVDLSFVTAGLTPAQRQSNAKYALSVADKMGCSLFLVWEDLVDLQPKMVLVLLASLMYLDQTKQRQHQVGDVAAPLAAAAPLRG